MPWYAAHAIMYFELTDGPQDGFQIYENVYLVRAETANEGFAKARELGRQNEGDDSGSLRVGNRPARRLFGGIRKLITVAHEQSDQLGHGDEITYSELVVADRAALQRLIEDEDCEVLYVGKKEL
jgi:hypothetical protein